MYIFISLITEHFLHQFSFLKLSLKLIYILHSYIYIFFWRKKNNFCMLKPSVKLITKIGFNWNISRLSKISVKWGKCTNNIILQAIEECKTFRIIKCILIFLKLLRIFETEYKYCYLNSVWIIKWI